MEDLFKQRETNKSRTYIVETHGCQMNVADSEIVASVLENAGYTAAEDITTADVILLNTCAIRENAETKIWNKLRSKYGVEKKKRPGVTVGVLGCMAERIKEKMLENEAVDLVAGPDAYRDLPRLLSLLDTEGEQSEQGAMNVQLSQDETYADILPVRKNKDALNAWISIMRGCNNMCSFCIVPFVRGRERNRPATSIVDEVRYLRDDGIKEITLLGQNVNSYHDNQQLGASMIQQDEAEGSHANSAGFSEMFKVREGSGARFADLMDMVSDAAPEIRFRFTSPHPKDFPDSILDVIASKANVCKQIHVPAQSGNTDMLFRMRRNHTREAYLSLISHMRAKIPGVALSTDFMCGFCDESEAEFEDTMTLLELVEYDLAFLFAYSMRERTHAHRRMQDNVPEDVKKARLIRMIELFKDKQLVVQKREIGSKHLVLVDGKGRRGEHQLSGLTDTMKRAVFDEEADLYKKGDFVLCNVTDATQNTLFCEPIDHMSIDKYFELFNGNRKAEY